MHYLFGFSGRINRAKMWLFILVGIVWEIVVLIVAANFLNWERFFPSLSVQMQSMAAAGQQAGGIDWAALAWPPLDSTKAWAGAVLLALLVILYTWAYFAVVVKRLHDRDKSAWWLLLYVGVPTAYNAVSVFPAVVSWANPVVVWSLMVAGLAILALYVWIFIEFFCLRGTTGENRFGPDPLA